MASSNPARFVTLLSRELREYKISLFWTPIVTAILLALVMGASVVLVNKFDSFANGILSVVVKAAEDGVNLSVGINEDDDTTTVEVLSRNPETGEQEITNIEIRRDENGEVISEERVVRTMPESPADAPPPPSVQDYRVIVEAVDPQEPWNFSREWNFDPGNGDGRDDRGGEPDEYEGRELNLVLSIVHGILTLILFIVSVNYLLGSLYDDRKEQSILFWRSMPVSEWELVLSKLVTALVVAPLIMIAVSLLLQLIYVVLMMALVYRMDLDPFEVVLQTIDFQHVMVDPISGWALTALLVAPAYAWLLCASALAKRSPLLVAFAPIIALVMAEGLLLRSSYVADALSRHVPGITEDSSLGFYPFGPDWSSINLMSIAAGLLFATIAIAVTVWLRKYRWEIS
ncbi:MAG: hypothetical protein AAGI88_06420 [Pseudomonadota bacterium]